MCGSETSPLQRRTALGELFAWAACLATLLFLLHLELFHATFPLIEPNEFWKYSAFKYFAESLLSHHFPDWNPWSNGGETFFPTCFDLKLMDLPTLNIFSVGLFTQNPLLIFNWDRLLQSIAAAAGCHLLLRRFSPSALGRITLVPLLLFSSVFFGILLAPAAGNFILWVPFAAYFAMRIIADGHHTWKNWLMFAAISGLTMQGDCYAGYAVFVLLSGLALFFFRRDVLLALIRRPPPLLMLLSALLVFGLMCAPRAVQYRAGFAYTQTRGPASQEVLSGGPRSSGNSGGETISHSTPREYLQAFAPEGHPFFGAQTGTLPAPRPFLYIGLFPLLVTLYGAAYSRHPFKRPWLFLLFSFSLLCLGPEGGALDFLAPLFPPLATIERIRTLMPFITLALFALFALGLEELRTRLHLSESLLPSCPPVVTWAITGLLGCALLITGQWLIATGMNKDVQPLPALAVLAAVLALRAWTGRTQAFVLAVAVLVLLTVFNLDSHGLQMLNGTRAFLFAAVPALFLLFVSMSGTFRSRPRQTSLLLFLAFCLFPALDCLSRFTAPDFVFSGQSVASARIIPLAQERRGPLQHRTLFPSPAAFALNPDDRIPAWRTSELLTHETVTLSPRNSMQAMDLCPTAFDRMPRHEDTARALYFFPLRSGTLGKPYRRLLQSPLTSEAKQEILTLGKAPVQPRLYFHEWCDAQNMPRLEDLGSDAAQFLGKVLIISSLYGQGGDWRGEHSIPTANTPPADPIVTRTILTAPTASVPVLEPAMTIRAELDESSPSLTLGLDMRKALTDDETSTLQDLPSLLSDPHAIQAGQAHAPKRSMLLKLPLGEDNIPEPPYQAVVQGSDNGKDWKTLASVLVRDVEKGRPLWAAIPAHIPYAKYRVYSSELYSTAHFPTHLDVTIRPYTPAFIEKRLPSLTGEAANLLTFKLPGGNVSSLLAVIEGSTAPGSWTSLCTLPAQEKAPGEWQVSFLNNNRFGSYRVSFYPSYVGDAPPVSPRDVLLVRKDIWWDSPQSLVMHTQSDHETWVYWADSYEGHWRALLDGKFITTYTANIGFKAVYLPVGSHELRFKFFHKYLYLARLFFYLGVLTAFMAMLLKDEETEKRDEGASDPRIDR